jgi:hypothetical protein
MHLSKLGRERYLFYAQILLRLQAKSHATHLKKEHRLQVSEAMMLKKIYGPAREKA